MTRHYERLFNPKIGSNLDLILFEMVSPIAATALQREIQLSIENYEPRATLTDVIVIANPDKNAYDVTLTFYIENASLPTTVTLLLERNR